MTTLYDQFGRPIESKVLRRPERREVAVATLRDRWSQYPSHNLTPGRLAAILREADQGEVWRQAELFEEMEEKDAHLSSQFQVRKLAVTGLDWEITPAGEDAQSRKIAEACTAQLEALELDEAMLDMLDALAKGYSLQEIIWDASGGQAVITDLRWVHPKKVTWRQSLTPRVLTEAEPINGEELAPWKWAYHRYKARSGYDTRAGIMRVCAWMYLFKNYAIKDWVAFSEIYGQPLRLGKYEQGASPEDREALIQAVRSIGTDAAGIISTATEIEFIEAAKTSSLNIYQSLTGFCDAQMSRAVLGQTLTSGDGGGKGSYALGQVHNEVRTDLIQADAWAVAKTVRAQILRPFVGFNFGWYAPLPDFRLLYSPPEDQLQAAQVYQVLTTIGMDISQEHLSERFSVPLRREGETPLARTQAGPGNSPEATALKRQALKADVPPAQPEHVTDILVARLSDQAGAALGDWVGAVRSLLDSSASLEDFRDGLESLWGRMEPGRYAELLAQGLILAELSGRYDARRD